MQNYFKRIKEIWNHPSNRDKQLKALGRAGNWQLKHKISEKPIDVNAFGYKILLYPDSLQTRAIVYYTPLKDYDVTQFIQRYLKVGDSFLDIGANIGLYTLLACSVVSKSGSVDSFEPCPKTFRRLEENVARNELNQVKLHQTVLGENSSVIKFTVDLDTINHVLSSAPPKTEDNYIEVSCQPLDEIINDKDYAMAKLDVEGYELPVLRGGSKMLSHQNPPVLMLEINEEFKRYGITALEIVNQLQKWGYYSASYDADSNELKFTNQVWDDVLFIHEDYQETVISRLNSHLPS